MIDLLIVNPGGQEIIYQGLKNTLTGIETPQWARLIAGYCRDRGYAVRILDAEAEALSPAAVARAADFLDPGLVCVVAHGHQPSSSAQSMPAVIDICKEIGGSRKVVVAGGVAATLPEKVLKDTGADYVALGDGAAAVADMLDGGGARGLYPGPALPLPTLEELHGDVWDLLPMTRYRAHNWQCFDGTPRQPYASIYTSLQCPFKCVFCCINAPFGGAGYKTRRPVDVVNEVRRLYEQYGVRTLRITDEMFVLKPSHYKPVCEGLAALPFADELNIWAYARVDTIRPDTLALLRKAGIRWLCLGIESGSSQVRDGSKKSLDGDDIRESVRAIQAAGISVLGNFIFGLPDDTLESMQATLELAMSVECEYSNFYSAMAYPGSRLYDMTDPKDLPKAWSGYSQHSKDTTPLPTAALSSRDVLRFRDDAFNTYFNDPAYLDRLGRKFGDHALREIETMMAYNLERAA